jgi:hypothetical protein
MICFKRITNDCNDCFFQKELKDDRWDFININTPLSGITFKDDYGAVYDMSNIYDVGFIGNDFTSIRVIYKYNNPVNIKVTDSNEVSKIINYVNNNLC